MKTQRVAMNLKQKEQAQGPCQESLKYRRKDLHPTFLSVETNREKDQIQSLKLLRRKQQKKSLK